MKPVKIIKHESYTGMYRLYYGKGAVSDNFWNISRANDILKNYDEYIANEEQSIRMMNNTFARCVKKPVQKSLEYAR